MKIVTSLLVIFSISLFLTYLVRHLARQIGIIAEPRKDRWHVQPTALLGGVAIYVSFVIGVSVYYSDITSIRRLLIGSGLLFIVGFVDDLVPIKPYIKLAAQLIAASSVVFTGIYLPWTQIVVLDIVLTFAWLVGITNAINMLDNMDGLAAGISIIACLFLSVTFYLNGQISVCILPLLLAAAITGFFIFNYNPASIFMGDCGSMFIGFMIAGMALISTEQRTRNIAAVLATPVLIMLMPIFDTTIVTISRRLNGRPLSQGGKDHSSHRLVALGMSDRRAVLTLYALSITAGVLALIVRKLDVKISIAIVSGSVLVIIFLGIFLGKVLVYEDAQLRHYYLLNGQKSHAYKKRLAEVLLDFILIILSYYTAYLLRFDGDIPIDQLSIYFRSLPYVIASHLFFFLLFGVYRGIWQHAGLEEIVQITKATILSMLCSFSLVFLLYHFTVPSRSVFIITFVVVVFATVLSRISYKLFSIIIVGHPKLTKTGKNQVYIYGANESGEMLLRELLNNKTHGYEPLGFIDDDPTKTGKMLRGYTVLSTANITVSTDSNNIPEILMFPNAIDVETQRHLMKRGFRCRSIRISFDQV